MLSIRGAEFSIVVFKTVPRKGDGNAIYGLKPQTCKFLRGANRFLYEDVFRSAIWLASRELDCLIVELIALLHPTELKNIADRLEALANE